VYGPTRMPPIRYPMIGDMRNLCASNPMIHAAVRKEKGTGFIVCSLAIT